jgi:glycosyltransferase involved in cell wall biosynthesis
MSLTVGFDATAAARQRAGIGRYSRELLTALARQPDHVAYKLFYCSGDGQYLPKLDGRVAARGIPVSDRIMNAIWHRARIPLPAQVFIGGFDLFHSPDFTIPPTLGRPAVLTIHDLAFLRHPEYAYPTLAAYLSEAVPRSAARARHIIAVSDCTRRDVVELLNIAPERVTTVYEGVSDAFRPADRVSAVHEVHNLGLPTPYILSVGTLEPRKNYVRLLEAYALLRAGGAEQHLVIAGGRGWLDDPIVRRIEDLRLASHVSVIRPDDRALAALYSAADVFVYPSLYEGFGIPPLEALACGAPSAVSNRSSLPEVVGDAAVLFDPADPQAIAGAIHRILTNSLLSDSLRRAGPERARGFSWDRAARETVEIYQEVAGSA